MAKFIPNWNGHYWVSQQTELTQSKTPPTAITDSIILSKGTWSINFFRLGHGRKIALQGQCWYQAKIKVTVFFLRNHKNTGKDKVVKFMVYKNLQSNKSLAK